MGYITIFYIIPSQSCNAAQSLTNVFRPLVREQRPSLRCQDVILPALIPILDDLQDDEEYPQVPRGTHIYTHINKLITTLAAQRKNKKQNKLTAAQ